MNQISNYSAWDIEPISPILLSPEKFYEHLVGWAIIAANSHNVQPWRFRVYPKNNAIALLVDKKGVLPASDKKGREAFISLGCALENLLTAAKCYGLEADVKYNESDNFNLSEEVVRVVFKNFPPIGTMLINPDLLTAMKTRAMNRSKYSPTKTVPKNVLDEMRASAENLNLSFRTITDPTTKFAIAEIQYFADRAVVMRTDFRRELADYLLPNDTESTRGMPGSNFGLSDKIALKAHTELGKEGSFDPDLAYGFSVSGRDGLKSAPIILVLSVKEDSRIYWIKSGRALQGIALKAELNGLSMAVHAAMVEVEMFNKLLKARLLSGDRPTVICRLGYATEIRPHAPRTTVNEVMEVIND